MAIADDADLKLVVEINLPDSVTALNIFYFKSAFASPQVEQDVLDALELWVEALYGWITAEVISGVTMGISTLYAWNSILVQWDNKGTFTPAVNFASIDDMLPHGVAAMVRMYSLEPRTIGRKYVPGFSEGTQTDGDWLPGPLGNLAAFLVAWQTTETISPGNTLEPGVWTTKYSVVYLNAGSGVILAQPAYQRRRRPGVGM